MPPLPDDDARRWLAALAARVEDDPALLDALSDADTERLLAAEDVSASGAVAAVRRRLRQAQRADLAPEAGRSAYAASRLWRWGGGVALVVTVCVAVWALWPGGGTTPAGEVLLHRAELVSLVGPPTKGDAGPPLARGARDLLAAASADPPDRPLAREAAETLAGVASTETDPERIGAAAYFAGLAYRLAGEPEEGDRWLRRVPTGTEHAARAAALL